MMLSRWLADIGLPSLRLAYRTLSVLQYSSVLPGSTHLWTCRIAGQSIYSRFVHDVCYLINNGTSADRTCISHSMVQGRPVARMDSVWGPVGYMLPLYTLEADKESPLTTDPTLAYQKDSEPATPDSTKAGTYDIVPSGADAGGNYDITYNCPPGGPMVMAVVASGVMWGSEL